MQGRSTCDNLTLYSISINNILVVEFMTFYEYEI